MGASRFLYALQSVYPSLAQFSPFWDCICFNLNQFVPKRATSSGKLWKPLNSRPKKLGTPLASLRGNNKAVCFEISARDASSTPRHTGASQSFNPVTVSNGNRAFFCQFLTVGRVFPMIRLASACACPKLKQKTFSYSAAIVRMWQGRPNFW